MKRSILTLIVVLTFAKSYGQDNNIKLDIVPLALGKINLSYERVVNDHQSAQIKLGFLIPRSLPGTLYDVSEVEDYGGTASLQNRIKGFSVSGEYRFYTGSSRKQSLRGFYFAPYLKWNKYKIETTSNFGYEANLSEYYELTAEQQAAAEFNGSGYDIDVAANFDAGFRQLGLGAMIGYQWLIADKVSIDWNFFGLGIDHTVFEVDISSEGVDVDYTKWGKEIEEEVKDFTVVGDKIEVTVEKNSVNAKAPFLLPNLRMSISVGIAF